MADKGIIETAKAAYLRLRERLVQPEKKYIGTLEINGNNLRIEAQDPNNKFRITDKEDDVTELTRVKLNEHLGTTVLVAHRNKRAGRLIDEIKTGETFSIKASGENPVTKTFEVVGYRTVRATEPQNPNTGFVNIDDENKDTGYPMNHLQAAYDLYKPENGGSVILQTSIVKDGEPYWGRKMVYAKEVTTS